MLGIGLYLTQGFVKPDGTLVTVTSHSGYLIDNGHIERDPWGYSQFAQAAKWAKDNGWICYRECCNDFSAEFNIASPEWNPAMWTPLYNEIVRVEKEFGLYFVTIDDGENPERYPIAEFMRFFRKGYRNRPRNDWKGCVLPYE